MLAASRCLQCNAQVAVPVDLAALTLRCAYCGHEQPVPDLAARRRALVDEQRERRLAEAQRHEQERARADERERAADRAAHRRGLRWSRVVSLLAALAAPMIVAVTVFDLPARLGFGAAGEDRLAQVIALRQSAGCTVRAPIASEYATATVSRLVAATGCVQILAAAGPQVGALGLTVFDAEGRAVGHSQSTTTDPQVTYCPPAPATLRYEIALGPASHGRLSHAVLACPAPVTAPHH